MNTISWWGDLNDKYSDVTGEITLGDGCIFVVIERYPDEYTVVNMRSDEYARVPRLWISFQYDARYSTEDVIADINKTFKLPVLYCDWQP